MGINRIKKRDGRTAAFEIEKIVQAIFKAANKVGGKDIEIARELANEVANRLSVFGIIVPDVETVQNEVEKVLMENGHTKTAKEFILYRANRSKIREINTSLMKIYEELTFSDASEIEVKRENGNIDGDSAMGTMLRYGSEGAKKFNLLYLITEEIAKAHRDGDIHIHDLDFYSLTTTCCQIDLEKLFDGGFNTGHGLLREPGEIRSYAALACISIQANQNDHHGGQSIPAFDHYMAVGVAKTFVKEIIRVLDTLYDNLNTHEVKAELKEYRKAHRLIIDSAGLAFVRSILGTKLNRKLTGEEIKRIIKIAMRATEDSTYQAMEAVIHNLNSMHCLPYSEKLWIYDKNTGNFGAVPIGLLSDNFEINRYQVISLNKLTGKAEFKNITAACKKDNNRRLITLRDISGHTVTVTDNHKVMTIEGNSISEGCPEEIKAVLLPRGIKFPCVNNDIGLEEYGSIRKNSPYAENHVVVSNAFAELMGYYVADGSLMGDTGTLCFTCCQKVTFEYIRNLMMEVFGKSFKEFITYYIDSNGETLPKDIRFGVGTRLTRMIAAKFGRGSKNKKIPTEILFASDEIKSAFIKAYFSCDGRKGKSYSECYTTNKYLRDQIGLVLMSMKGLPSYNNRTSFNGFDPMADSCKTFSLILGSTDSLRTRLKDTCEAAFEIPKYTLRYTRNANNKIYDSLGNRHSGEIRYNELAQMIELHGVSGVNYAEHIFTVPIDRVSVSNSGEEYVYDISIEDNENFLTAEGIYVHNSRAGAQVPFSSLNYGTDISNEGRMVTKNILLATEAGLGDGETPIFPIQIFKMKKGVNLAGDINYDLFQLACRVSAKRLFPNFSNMDAPFNAQYYKEGRPETEVAYMGCRTRVIGNTYDPDNEVVTGRGNLSFTTINLPRLALESGQDNIEEFFELLENRLQLVEIQLLERYRVQCRKHPKNFPFLMGQGIWLGSDELGPNDDISEVLKQGTLSLGFIGLAETLIALTGKHHGESEESQQIGLSIIQRMRDFCDEKSVEYDMNFSLLATPAEGIAGRFIGIDKKKYGEITRVTDKEYYTNSYHVPVYHSISAFKKIKIEAPYHKMCNAGHITYIEIDGDPSKNLEAFEKVVMYMHDNNIGYGAINHPVDRDPVCGYTGIIDNDCPRCGRAEGEPMTMEMWNKIKGYTHNADTCGTCGNPDEEADRVANTIDFRDFS